MDKIKANIDLLIKIVGIAFALGMGYQQFTAIRADIARLESKQEKYNNLQERVLRNELKIENFDKAIAELKRS